jgi:hypothetical protein
MKPDVKTILASLDLVMELALEEAPDDDQDANEKYWGYRDKAKAIIRGLKDCYNCDWSEAEKESE